MVCPHLKPPKLQYIVYPGIVFLLSGFTLLFLWSSIYASLIINNLGLVPNSSFFQMWRKTDVPNHMQVYLFNWTNPEDGHNASVKPRFAEIGPFTFKEYKQKFDITFNPENSTMSFRQRKMWFFDEYASCRECSLDRKITTLNVVLVSLSHKTKDYSGILKLLVSTGFRAMSPDIFVTRTARELLFEGYVDNLLATMRNMGVSNLPEDGRFGFFFGKNESSLDGVYNIDTRPSQKGLIREWNHRDHTKFFQGVCSNVEGTTAEMYPPNRDRTSVAFFSGDMCRQLKLDYDRDHNFHGLNTYRFIANTSLLDNGTLLPENACYCNGKCMPSGVMNVSACRAGSPTFISLPHFLNADPVYVNSVEGLSPSGDRHQLYQLVEPNTGLVLEAAIRIQMNFHLKPIRMMPIIDDVPDVMFPVFWFQVHGKGPPEAAANIALLLSVPTILQTIAYIVIALGVLMIAVGLFVRHREKPSILPDLQLHSEALPLKQSEVDGLDKPKL